MAETAHAALDTFVEGARSVFRETEDAREQALEVTALAEDLLAERGWFEEAIDFDGRRYRGEFHRDDELGHPGAGFTVKGSVTHPDDDPGGAIPHDHGPAWVVYGVYRGSMEQYRYRWDYDEDGRDPQLVERGSFAQEPGEVMFHLPGEIHRTNVVSEEPVWYVRIESQHLSTVDRHRYDPGTGEITPM